jgi:hypothetical protein
VRLDRHGIPQPLPGPVRVALIVPMARALGD